MLPDGRSSRRRLTVVALGAALVVLAVVGGWFRGQRAERVAVPPAPADRADLPTLPPYVMNMAGGDVDLSASTPGDPMGPPVIADAGARLEVAVRAEVEVKIRVHVKLYWRMGDRLARWHPDGQYGPFSTYRYRGKGEAPFGPGKGDLLVIVSPVDDIPDQIFATWLGRPPSHWQIMRQPVVWRAAR